ncbi:hypothetical protein, partial [Pantoea brenneri]|uniref:hypothetical protein n=1 Tax=Pantoea brenneri TaxID=472694 RepID=UPI001F22C8DC
SGHGSGAEQDDKGRNAGKRAYCLKICPDTGTLAPNLIYSTKPIDGELSQHFSVTTFYLRLITIRFD